MSCLVELSMNRFYSLWARNQSRKYNGPKTCFFSIIMLNVNTIQLMYQFLYGGITIKSTTRYQYFKIEHSYFVNQAINRSSDHPVFVKWPEISDDISMV